MRGDYNPKAFWDARFRRYGHTEIESLARAYDHPLRLKAIDKALSHAKIRINRDTKILDIGCGTGDLIFSFLGKGVLDITGIDLSSELTDHARRRFAPNRNVKLLTVEAENMDFSPSSFDLVTSITVLQHITDEEVFFRAVRNIVGVIKTGGHICVMDFSPVRVKDRQPASYLTIRSRGEYIEAFESSGCRLICEFGLPRIGVRLYRVIGKAMAKAGNLLPRAVTSSARQNNRERGSTDPPKSVLLWVYTMMGRITLKFAKPLDNFLFPFPSRYTDMRILIFVKTVR